MAGRYGQFGRTLGDDLKKKKKGKEITDPNDEGAGGNPNVKRDPVEVLRPDYEGMNSVKPINSEIPPYNNGGLKDIPILYEGEGKNRKINPNYDTSIGRDMLAGAGMAKPTGNPFYDLGAALGGLVGGAFNKNLAGKQQHQEDVERIQAENKDKILKTEAYQRAEAQKLAQQREARLAQANEFKQQMETEKQKVKGLGDTSRFLTQAAQAAPTPEARMELSQQFNDLWNIDDQPNANFGQKYKVEKIGDYAMLFDEQTGELINAKGEDGKPISDLDTSKQLDILKKWTGLSEKETPDLESAMKQADKYLNENFKGIKATQIPSIKMQLTREILKMKKEGGSGRVIVNGQLVPLPELGILEQKPPLAKEDASPFMTDQKEGQTDIVDATNGQPPNNIPRTTEGDSTKTLGGTEQTKEPQQITESDAEYPLSIVSGDGKSYATRQVQSGTENLDKKKSYMSKDKKTRLVWMDGAWYQVKLQ